MMKKILIISLFILTVYSLTAQVEKSIKVVVSGTLSTLLTTQEKATVTNLIVTGNIDMRDFLTMNNMSKLAILNLSGVNISSYSGAEGSNSSNVIPDYAFNNNFSLTTITLPINITSIGVSAFSYCNYLQSISFPESLTNISKNAFFYCPKLSTTIKIPSSIINIGESAFGYSNGNFEVATDNPVYSSLDGVLFDKLKTTLLQCPSSKSGSYIIPSSVSKISSFSFYLCNQITSITIPSSVTTIEHHAFYACKNLASISIPSTTLSIGTYAFMSVNGPISVEQTNPNYSSIDGVLFNKSQNELIQCPTSKVGAYSIPSSVTTIDGLAFAYCSNLSNIDIPSSVNYIGTFAFSDCTGLQNITIPDLVTTINNSTFSNCTKLSTIILPKTLKTIGNNAFSPCGLTSITIPSSVTSIGSTPFCNCSNLNSIYVNTITPLALVSANSVFLTVNKTSCILYVPKGSKNAYQSAEQWKDFKNIVEISTGLKPISQSNIKVTYDNNNLIIENAKEDCKIEIYNFSGIKIKERRTTCNQTRIQLEKGIYLIRIDNYSDKDIIK